MRSALLALLLAGCAHSPPHEDDVARGVAMVPSEPRTECPSIPCIGRVTSDRPINCRAFAANVQLARRILDEAAIVPRAEFCGACYRYPVHVRDAESWDNGETLSETRFGRITLSRRGIHLAHELLHLWDERHFVLNPDHNGWDVNGYRDADNRFRDLSVKYVPFESLTPGLTFAPGFVRETE